MLKQFCDHCGMQAPKDVRTSDYGGLQNAPAEGWARVDISVRGIVSLSTNAKLFCPACCEELGIDKEQLLEASKEEGNALANELYNIVKTIAEETVGELVGEP